MASTVTVEQKELTLCVDCGMIKLSQSESDIAFIVAVLISSSESLVDFRAV